MSSPSQPDISQFGQVDAAPPTELIRWLQAARALPAMQRCKQIALDELRLRPGHVVLDVGCGYGADVFELAQRVGPGGRAVGVDLSDAMIAEARNRFELTGLAVTFEAGDARRLRFADASFDRCRAETLLQHVRDPGRAVAEMARVTRPGGRVVAVDLDLGGLVVDSPDRDATRWLLAEVTDSMASGWIGRQLPGLFAEAGLADARVRVEFATGGHAFFERVCEPSLGRLCRREGDLAARMEAWHRQLMRAAASGRFFSGAPVFVVSATKAA